MKASASLVMSLPEHYKALHIHVYSETQHLLYNHRALKHLSAHIQYNIHMSWGCHGFYFLLVYRILMLLFFRCLVERHCHGYTLNSNILLGTEHNYYHQQFLKTDENLP